MESFVNRYRNTTVLLLVVFAQLLLLGFQVRKQQDVPLIRMWTVTAVTPVARMIEGMRGGGIGFIRSYFLLHGAEAENRRLREEVGKLRIENTFLRNDLNRADRAQALQLFQSRTPSKLLAASIIATGAGGANAKIVFSDRGSVAGVMRGMAVVTPDGVVGKIIAAYPTASEVMLVTDPEFAAGVVSQKTQIRGTVKGQGHALVRMDYVPNEQKVEVGEMLFTSGDDRIFPRGFQVGVVKVVRPGQPFQEILVQPTALERGMPEDVLIVVNSVHQEIPSAPPVTQPVYIAPPPPSSGTAVVEPQQGAAAAGPGTEADKLRSIYKAVGEAQNHTYGEGPPGSKPPDFTKLPATPAAAAAAAAAGVGGRGPGGAAKPAVGGPGTGTGNQSGAGSQGPATGAPAGAVRTPAAGAGAVRTPATGAPAGAVRTPATGEPAGAVRNPSAPPATRPAPEPRAGDVEDGASRPTNSTPKKASEPAKKQTVDSPTPGPRPPAPNSPRQ